MSAGDSLWARLHEHERLIMKRGGVIDTWDHLQFMDLFKEVHALEARYLHEQDQAERPNVVSFTDALRRRRRIDGAA